MKLGRIAIAAVVAVAFAGGAAHADDNKVKAVALFDEGLKAMKAGNYAKACKALDASNRLVSDSGTRGSLARCYTKLGRSASAWTLWRELADTAPSDDLREDAAEQAEKLEPRLAKYVIKVTAPAAGLTVTVAGEAIDPSLDVPVPIDPGTYPVEATAPGRVAWKGELTAAEGKSIELMVPALAASAAPPPPEKPIRPGKVGRGRRIGGVVLVGLGLGGLGAGGGFTVIARRRNAEAKEICGGDIDRCEPTNTADAQGKIDDARLAANISTAAFIAGGALVVTGVILYITAPKAERRAVSIAPLVDATTAGIALSGRY
jgi:tetratricopeptide (TPR) repeat protein